MTLNDGSSSHYHGCLLAFLGDTPASALAGGFKEGVGGAYRCCSTCMITSSDLDSTVGYVQDPVLLVCLHNLCAN